MSDDALTQIAKDVAALRAALAAGALAFAMALGAKVSPTSTTGAGASGGGGGVASDRELDGEYGDPEIRRDPPRWTGEPFAGRRYSETSPEYLDCVADFNDWRADKDDESGAKDNKGRPKSAWARKDARLARGWAARLRSGWRPKANGFGGGKPVSDEDYGDSVDSDVPF